MSPPLSQVHSLHIRVHKKEPPHCQQVGDSSHRGTGNSETFSLSPGGKTQPQISSITTNSWHSSCSVRKLQVSLRRGPEPLGHRHREKAELPRTVPVPPRTAAIPALHCQAAPLEEQGTREPLWSWAALGLFWLEMLMVNY